ncbi:MAG TPA: hypothetical protein VN026_17970 [Bacteroidia bacterium]|jgi:aspartyl-tRNA(Asn)/glutamyl-tRNA(Gln) amidotransferase subunit B|nr:hypothetical protein [Bacteroidia bacterium]
MEDKELMNICKEVLESCPNKVNDYHLGKTELMGMFAGEVMKRSKGKADPKKIVEFLKVLLKRK